MRIQDPPTIFGKKPGILIPLKHGRDDFIAVLGSEDTPPKRSFLRNSGCCVLSAHCADLRLHGIKRGKSDCLKRDYCRKQDNQ